MVQLIEVLILVAVVAEYFETRKMRKLMEDELVASTWLKQVKIERG